MDDNAGQHGAGSDDVVVESLAAELLTAPHGSTTCWQPSLPLVGREMAYKVQDEVFCQIVESGDSGVGVAVIHDRHRDAVETAWLTGYAHDGPPVSGHVGDYLVAPIFAFVLGRRLVGQPLFREATLAAVDRVYGGLMMLGAPLRGYLEAIASRGSSKTATDAARLGLVAQNLGVFGFASSGISMGADQADLRLEASLVEVDGAVVSSTSGAVLGNPVDILHRGVADLLARGHVLMPGWVICVGLLCDPILVAPGQLVTATFTRLGSVSVGGTRNTHER